MWDGKRYVSWSSIQLDLHKSLLLRIRVFLQDEVLQALAWDSSGDCLIVNLELAGGRHHLDPVGAHMAALVSIVSHNAHL